MLDGTETQTDTSARQDSSEGKQETSEKQEPRLIPETEAQKLVSDALAKAGRDAKSLETRKAELDRQAQDIADWQAKKDEEERKAVESNPELLDVYQQKKALKDKEAALKKRENELEQEKLAHQVEIESAREVQRDVDVFEIAQEYEGGDAMKLKNLCVTFNASTKEQIRKAADTLWEKKTSQSSSEKTKRDSGLTIGGGTRIGDLPPKERVKEADKLQRSK